MRRLKKYMIKREWGYQEENGPTARGLLASE